MQAAPVALRKESVDRNVVEIRTQTAIIVALRKESVDRNPGLANILVVGAKSLSARRAWIEIPAHCPRLPTCAGRSPQGERG